MALKRMDNVGIVVEDLGGTIDFFRELGLELEGRATIEGEWAGRVTGLGDERVEIPIVALVALGAPLTFRNVIFLGLKRPSDAWRES